MPTQYGKITAIKQGSSVRLAGHARNRGFGNTATILSDGIEALQDQKVKVQFTSNFGFKEARVVPLHWLLDVDPASGLIVMNSQQQVV